MLSCKYLLRLIKIFLIVFFFQNALFSQTDTLEVDDILSMSIEEMLNVKIYSATLHEENLLEIPATIYLTNKEELEQFAFFDLKDVLFHTPGVEYAYPHSWLQGGQRGVTGNWSKSKLLINGIDINLLYTGEAFMGNQFFMENVERVEVVQGPGSVIYGADAFSGIINIVTEEPSNNGINAKIGTFAGISDDRMSCLGTNVSIAGLYDKISFNLSGGYKYLNDVDFSNFVQTKQFSRVNTNLRQFYLQSGQEPYLDDNFAYSFNLGLQYRPNEKNVLKLYLMHLFDEDGGGQEYAEISFKHFKSTRQQEFAALQYEHFFNNIHSLELKTQFRYDKELNDWIYSDTLNGQISPVFSWDVDGSTSFQTDLLWKVNASKKKNFTIFGVGYRNDNLAEIYFEEATFEHLRPFLNPVNYYLFLQSQQYFFNKKLYAIVGVRKDFHSIYDAPITFRGGLTYKITEKFQAKYFYSDAFRAPTLFDLEINDGLLPESNHTHELSFNFKPTSNLFFQTSVYSSYAHDLIITEKAPSSASDKDVFISTNNGEQYYKGNETLVKFKNQFFSLEYWINYTHKASEIKVASWKSGIKLNYKIKKKNSISCLMKYTSEIETDFLDEEYEVGSIKVAPFFRTDISWLSKDLNLWDKIKFDFSFSIQNIFNKENFYPNLRGNDPIQFKEQMISYWAKFRIKF